MMKNVLPVKVDVPYGKKVGVFVSGGWDSAVLLYLVWSKCLKQGNELCVYTVPKLDGAVNYAEKVVEWCRYKLIAQRVEHKIVGDISANDPSSYVTSGVIEALTSREVDLVYVAVTKYYDGMEPDHDRQHASQYGGEHVCLQPFHNITKDQTVQLAFDLGIAEDIMDITHSCTELDEGRCGYCPWCKERQWAFEKIGKEDRGTN